MKTIAVISGKGGTGKTTVTASLARLFSGAGQKVVLADADVDASNLSLMLHPKPAPFFEYSGSEKAFIDPEVCNGCGVCLEYCRFGALEPVADGDERSVRVKPLACEGCAVCTVVCPQRAVSMRDEITGDWSLCRCDTGFLAYARLGVGGENSGRLVTHVRKVAAEKAAEIDADLLIIDGPPGTGCPVISAVTGVDLVLYVTEPTPSGLSDLERALKMVGHFSIPGAIVVNKADLNPSLVRSVSRDLEERGFEVVGELPYDESVPLAQRQGRLPVDTDNDVGRVLGQVQERLSMMFRENSEDQLFAHSVAKRQEAHQ